MCGFVKIFQRQSLEFFKNFPAERRNRFLPYLQHQIAVKPCCKRGCQINQQQLQTNPPKSCKIEYGNIFINRNTNQAGCVNRTKGCKCNTDNETESKARILRGSRRDEGWSFLCFSVSRAQTFLSVRRDRRGVFLYFHSPSAITPFFI